jgi:hypothetical protein
VAVWVSVPAAIDGWEGGTGASGAAAIVATSCFLLATLAEWALSVMPLSILSRFRNGSGVGRKAAAGSKHLNLVHIEPVHRALR